MSVLLVKVKNVLFGAKYLWVTNVVTSGVLLGVGDVIQQNIEMYSDPERKSTLDSDRISMCLQILVRTFIISFNKSLFIKLPYVKTRQ